MIFLRDKNITLAKFTSNNITERYICWLNDKEITKYLCTGRFPLSEFDIKWKDDQNNIRFAILYDDPGPFYIGTISVNNIDWVSRKCDIGYLIGDKKYWGKGISTRTIALVVKYVFDTLGLNKVTAGVVDGNIGLIKALTKNGFIEYGINPQDHFLDGKLLDTHLFYKIKG